ncbi:large conductance mechanosensitive channel protein MscL [Phycicoccus sp. M110.8]|uniref:large conductance mechanosensitive channel protein MscL n=1 Tax=Phycicoccus sp. M110.8 TaxID=3075433 RepID=UPI0028FD4B79|nr:large conductance mechanosensitive channel protein MscL [Phycicoccus sp. M110.8]MDU0313167.1 large conductance mechanosensitive channel protein MscL [Phycicoccus sp. M110.8]HET8768112.1 large conductance mechanosensitive channel protein MscL [Pedococcus sp.]
MKGFKDFIMRGNLIELAVAFIIGAAFAAVVTSFTKVIIELLAKAGGAPNFDKWQPGGLVSVGPFLTALVAFLIMAAVVYFFIVKPYEAVKARYAKAEEDAAPDEQVVLLREIRDALTRRI